MGTHVTIDDDVVRAAEKLAQEQDRTVGEVISELARRALPVEQTIVYQNGIPQLPISNPRAVVTLDHVNELRDEGP
ncbi:MAG TPA: CopG family transcriptional regulator [Bosea sp. (in: a-proteobacteria)]